MPSYGLEPQIVMTTPLLEGLDGVEKMSKSLGNYIGVTESAEVMYSKVLSISDELMWKYYTLLTDLSLPEIEAERAKDAPMASKMSLARRLVADFHGASAAPAAEAEWRQVHQERQAPTDMPERRIAPGAYKIHELLAAHGLAKSKSDAARLVRQRAVKRDGQALDGSAEVRAEAGVPFVVSVGPKTFVRFVVADD